MNLPSVFEEHWQKCREARLQEEREAQQRARNPHKAGANLKRSKMGLLTVWLIVERTKRFTRTKTPAACKLLAKPPSRREASQWPDLLVYRDPRTGPYYVKTPGNLRDVYNNAVRHYSAGSETLRRS